MWQVLIDVDSYTRVSKIVFSARHVPRRVACTKYKVSEPGELPQGSYERLKKSYDVESSALAYFAYFNKQ